MKLGKSVLVEIIAAVQKGLVEGVDISDELRNIDVTVCALSDGASVETVKYAKEHPEEQV